MYGMFVSSSVNQPLDGWDVSKVTNMGAMFYQASSFNQPLNVWDVSKVTDMEVMFSMASSFNQPLNGWNVSKLFSMRVMFYEATNFNQNLCQWGKIPSFPYGSGSTNMFLGSGCTNKSDPIVAIQGPFCASNCA